MKGLSRSFTKDITQVAKIHMKGCLTILVTGENANY